MGHNHMMSRLTHVILTIQTLTMLSHAQAVMAETQLFDVHMMGRTLGQVTYSRTQKDHGLHSTLTARLNNTPMGVFDGVFIGVRQPSTGPDGRQAYEYRVSNVSPKRTRKVSVLFRNERVVQTRVTPPYKNAMALDLENAPLIATDMIDAFGAVSAQTQCPGSLRIYDGRRLIRVSPKSSIVQSKQLTCLMTYKVIKGPGHLHPFNFRSVGVSLTYKTDALGRNALDQIDLNAGVFNISLLQNN
ncbi:hypothetical protein DS909_00990 [Phaeobacter gallaeciensis]|uniref:DUF3108 domain-containing protein n=3 Tax=Roseobacteraceae TaxID=2854170 RepID=A0A366XF51_9RHOB|nr:DUF3108 domain-containing protein [Phaeobacter gallaeciensis]MBT3140482.1 DUF3108 domain-containing protein [Falsiruegeria litorea]RBW62213.1 hypothetical protein DS909_00990 [Phaeobacter gallaeciensis]